MVHERTAWRIVRIIYYLEAEGVEKNRAKLYKARHIRDILTRWKFTGLNRKLQMKPRKWIEEETADGDIATVCSELQLIVKWGGDLTKLGEKQAIRLGNRLRDELYPSNKDGGILRLHSTFRHDLKIKTSDEGRVMKTAASFAKGIASRKTVPRDGARAATAAAEGATVNGGNDGKEMRRRTRKGRLRKRARPEGERNKGKGPASHAVSLTCIESVRLQADNTSTAHRCGPWAS